MIDNTQVDRFRVWFFSYVKGFYNQNQHHDLNIELKEKHTIRVCEEIAGLGKSIDLDEGMMNLARVAALFHDIGRFEQYSRYGTFADKKSENHAALGIRVLVKEGILNELCLQDRAIILGAISYHNRAEIPAEADGDCLLLAKMLRDADKLDIWKVVTNYYHQKDGVKNKSIELDLPDTQEVSELVVADIIAGRIVKNTSIKTLNDFKLMQMGWVFDLNFSHSFEAVKKRQYIEKIRDVISNEKYANFVYTAVEKHLSQCVAEITS